MRRAAEIIRGMHSCSAESIEAAKHAYIILFSNEPLFNREWFEQAREELKGAAFAIHGFAAAENGGASWRGGRSRRKTSSWALSF